MSEIETTRTVKCDNCGATETQRIMPGGVNPLAFSYGGLPSLNGHPFAMNMLGGGGKDYCPACREAVQKAIDQALLLRRHATV